MQLIPVVEFAPASYQAQPHPSPTGSVAEQPEAWDRYWKASLADAGITQLEPLTPGSWLVPTECLVEPEVIARMLIAHFTALELYDAQTGNMKPVGDEEASALHGGYALVVNDSLTVLPQCCGDLGNIAEWNKAAGWTLPTDEQVWIGHPWLLVRAEGNRLHFTRTAEYGPPPEPATFILERADLQHAVDNAHAEQRQFARRLLPFLQRFAPEQAEFLADILAGLCGGNA